MPTNCNRVRLKLLDSTEIRDLPSTITRARALIQSRLAELDAEAKKLERALASMGERTAPRRRPGRPKKPRPLRPKPNLALPANARATRKRKSAKRARRGQSREQLLAAAKPTPVPVLPSSPARSPSRPTKSTV
jgi:hypothetical protein